MTTMKEKLKRLKYDLKVWNKCKTWGKIRIKGNTWKKLTA